MAERPPVACHILYRVISALVKIDFTRHDIAGEAMGPVFRTLRDPDFSYTLEPLFQSGLFDLTEDLLSRKLLVSQPRGPLHYRLSLNLKAHN